MRSIHPIQTPGPPDPRGYRPPEMLRQIYTSESVSEGHPDKIADQVSDAILDAILAQDPTSRVAVETLVAHGFAVVAGEVTTNAYVDVSDITRRTIKDAGYTSTDLGFDGGACGVLVSIHPQSNDIAIGVDTGGAGDQGMMFGMATDETPEMMPLTIAVAHALTRQSALVRRQHPSLGFRPDAKSQVSVVYEDGRPSHIETVVLSQQHDERPIEVVRQQVQEYIIQPVLEQYSQYVKGDLTYHINPTGQFIVGGPKGDTGLTGRKIIVDTYGGMCPHGGGAFSGKDPTKVDRSAAYMARYVSKLIVAAGLARKCQVALAYAIGVAQPVSLNIETYGTETVAIEEIEKRVKANFDMSPAGIIKELGLRDTGRIQYLKTAKNGHFGNPAFPWEDVARADVLK